MKYNGEEGLVWEVSYRHSYALSGFDTNKKGRHNCLRRGEWCWENLWEYPLDIFSYLRHKI